MGKGRTAACVVSNGKRSCACRPFAQPSLCGGNLHYLMKKQRSRVVLVNDRSPGWPFPFHVKGSMLVRTRSAVVPWTAGSRFPMKKALRLHTLARPSFRGQLVSAFQWEKALRLRSCTGFPWRGGSFFSDGKRGCGKRRRQRKRMVCRGGTPSFCGFKRCFGRSVSGPRRVGRRALSIPWPRRSR